MPINAHKNGSKCNNHEGFNLHNHLTEFMGNCGLLRKLSLKSDEKRVLTNFGPKSLRHPKIKNSHQ